MKIHGTFLACCLIAAPWVAGCDDDDDITGVDGGMDAGLDAFGEGRDAAGGAGGDAAGGNDVGGMAGMDAGPGGMDAGGDAALGDAGGDAVLAMPRGAGNPPTLGNQIDRVGRPAITTATVATFSADMAAKDARRDAYNSALPATWASFKADIKASLPILDALNGDCGSQLMADGSNDRYNPLATVLADDQLYVNSTVGECGVYLGAEAEFLMAVAAGEGKCGGRTPMDDVIDRSYSILATSSVAQTVEDGVTMDDATHSLTNFPFLAAP